MDLELEGKVAAITGAAAGIGAAIALALAREGCDVAVVDCHAEPRARTTLDAIEAQGRRARYVQADVRDHDGAAAALASIVSQLGRLDIVVCNAGIVDDATVRKMTQAQWQSVIDVNLTGVFNYSKAAASIFRSQGSGKIVNVASINGLRGKFGQANYAASKAGIVALSKSLAREMGKYNVNVNVIAPGMVSTAMADALPESIRQRAIDETVLGRLARPEDCGDLVAFLCSERARHITGEVIKIDGGQYM